jgi:hypothetical protein
MSTYTVRYQATKPAILLSGAMALLLTLQLFDPIFTFRPVLGALRGALLAACLIAGYLLTLNSKILLAISPEAIVHVDVWHRRHEITWAQILSVKPSEHHTKKGVWLNSLILRLASGETLEWNLSYERVDAALVKELMHEHKLRQVTAV